MAGDVVINVLLHSPLGNLGHTTRRRETALHGSHRTLRYVRRKQTALDAVPAAPVGARHRISGADGVVLLGERRERCAVVAVLAGRRPLRALVPHVMLEGAPCQRSVASVRASRRLMITDREVSVQLRHGTLPRAARASIGAPDSELQDLLLDGLVEDGREFRVATVRAWTIFGLELLGYLL